MKNNEQDITPDLQSNDIMKCLYFALARRSDAQYTYIYSLVSMRDKNGQYPLTPQINIETFKDAKRADLAYMTKQEIMQAQSRLKCFKTITSFCADDIKGFHSMTR